MPGANGERATCWEALVIPFTCTLTCADFLDASASGTSRLICASLLNRIVASAPSNVTLRFDPEKREPMIVASDPGASGPLVSVAAFSALVTVGDGVAAAVIFSVTGICREPAIGPASMVSVA